MNLPDFTAMTDQEKLAWVDEHLADLVAGSQFAPAGQRGTVVGHETDELRVTTIRLPVRMLAELDEVAGRHRDGRAGVIRAAVDHYLAHLRDG